MELIEQMTRPHLIYMLAKYVPANRFKGIIEWKTEHLQGLLKFYLTPEHKDDMIGEYEFPIGFAPAHGATERGKKFHKLVESLATHYIMVKNPCGRHGNDEAVIVIEVGKESNAIVENLKHLLKL